MGQTGSCMNVVGAEGVIPGWKSQGGISPSYLSSGGSLIGEGAQIEAPLKTETPLAFR